MPPETVDAVWLFPARQLGARESGLAVLSVFAQGDQARRTRTIHTLHYVMEPPAPRARPVRRDELEEQGTVPLDRVDRIIEGVLRRLDVPETPDVRETAGDPEAWRALLAELGGVPLDAAPPSAAGSGAEDRAALSHSELDPDNQESLSLGTDPSPADPDDQRT